MDTESLLRIGRSIVLLICFISVGCGDPSMAVNITIQANERVQCCELRNDRGLYSTDPAHCVSLRQEDAQKLAQWVRGKGQWSPDRNTYAPALVFKGQFFNLNVSALSAILNYSTATDHWRQVRTPLTPSDAELLKSFRANGEQVAEGGGL